MTAAALALAAVLSLAPTPTVTLAEYDAAQIGWSRHHVQRVYGTTGTYVVKWFDGLGHMRVEKTYSTDDGGTTSASYRDSRATEDGTQQGVMRLVRKAWES